MIEVIGLSNRLFQCKLDGLHECIMFSNQVSDIMVRHFAQRPFHLKHYCKFDLLSAWATKSCIQRLDVKRFSLNLSANLVMRGRVHTRRTLKVLVKKKKKKLMAYQNGRIYIINGRMFLCFMHYLCTRKSKQITWWKKSKLQKKVRTSPRWT